ncbi:hypothetical protein C8Q76DRAFT_767797 [Earliella scabrosa]|nr:hypothetical protein C8Q76DRAFT_767797 [Earliella scabrosa]
MSSDSDDLTQEIFEAYHRLVVENYCIIASSVLLFADTLFTFTDEVQRIWRRRFTGATLIFLLTRWVAVAERIVLVISVVMPTVQDKVLLRLDDTLTDISYLMFGVFMMLRIRGVWGGRWTPVILIGLMTPIRPIMSIYMQSHYTPIAFGVPLYGCGAVFAIDRVLYTKAAGIAIDAAVLVLTWYKTYRIKMESRRLGLHTPYITLLIRDGEIILLVQILGIVSISDFPLFIIWPYFDQVFTVIFLTRFMLNLRGVYLSDRSGTSTTSTSGVHSRSHTVSGIRFSSSVTVGNMGAPLHSSFGSRTLNSVTIGGHDDGYAQDFDENRAVGKGWEMEDERLETSSDPLFAGLKRDGESESDGLELQSSSPRQG